MRKRLISGERSELRSAQVSGVRRKQKGEVKVEN